MSRRRMEGCPVTACVARSLPLSRYELPSDGTLTSSVNDFVHGYQAVGAVEAAALERSVVGWFGRSRSLNIGDAGISCGQRNPFIRSFVTAYCSP